MLKIRLMRIGARKRPFYRVVVVDERAKRNGAYIELVGTYNPLTQPHDIKLKQDRIDHWLKMGAIKSNGFLRILGEAPQRPPRKPKKPARNISQSDAGGEKQAPKEAPAEKQEQPTEEAPAEEVVAEEPVDSKEENTENKEVKTEEAAKE